MGRRQGAQPITTTEGLRQGHGLRGRRLDYYRESPSAAPATQSSRGVNGVQAAVNGVQSRSVNGVQSRAWRLQRVTKSRLPRKEAAASSASKAVLGEYRGSPSAAPATQSSRGQRRPKPSLGSVDSHQALRLPRKAAAAPTASKAAASTASKCRQETTESHGVQRHPGTTTESPSAAPATQSSRGVNGLLQRATKCRHCHAKQPRRQRRPKPSSRCVNGVQSRPEYRESPRAAPAMQSSRGVNGVQSRPGTTENNQVPRLPRKSSRGVNGLQSRGVNGVQRRPWI